MWRRSLTGVLLVVSIGCSHPTSDVLVEYSDVAAVAGSVSALSGGLVAGATVRIDAYRVTGATTQFIESFTEQTDSQGRFFRVLVLGPLGMQQCQLHIAVTPPVGSGLTVKADSVMAQVNRTLPPADTAKLNFVLTSP